MARIAKHLGPMTEETMILLHGRGNYMRPHLDFLSEPQDARGLPLSLNNDEEYYQGCCVTYDYASIPDVVISNGYNDWPLKIWELK